MTAPRGFDRLARIYRLLECVAFGPMLQRARAALFAALPVAPDVLLLGDGDGRGLEALLHARPAARVTTVDASAAMLARARMRVQSTGVSFVHADARTLRPPAASLDVIATMFFFDCFTPAEVTAMVETLALTLRPTGQWLFVDFSLPEGGWRRLYARLVVAGLYAFFRWQTGIEARSLPGSEAILERAGFRPVETRTFAAGLIRCVRFEWTGAG